MLKWVLIVLLHVATGALAYKLKEHAELLLELIAHNTAQDARMSGIEDRATKLASQIAENREEIAKHVPVLEYHGTEIKTIQMILGKGTPKVAFTACSTSNQVAQGDTPLIFDKIILNEGNTYDATTGVFKAPVDGIYAFFCSLKTTFMYPDVNLTLGDDNIVIFSSDDTIVGGAVKFLCAGDSVFLKPSGSLGSLQGSPVCPSSTFWGFRVY